ncbi:N-acetylmuramidase domain-containing protein [Mesorhizobium ciceri]|uniref:N-acetylmuramidase domain-containing protein n=1 Tax=Mesorhizobium TaxID=68287 RepID=UPI0004ACF58C|nr:N-acetylmuramidase domain-containing protein [Mesorhizobium ciceri]
MFDAPTLKAIGDIADHLKCEPSALQAVAEVESAGQVTAMVKGRMEPLIRWEGHYFDQRLTGSQRAVARAQGLASPTAGAVKNPASQAKRWEIVTRATLINRQAALESFSIGLGQVMTAHWKRLGFASVDAMIARARDSAAGQIDIMARFIEKFGLADELQRLDFTGFARGYNGSGFRKNGYHLKMAAAYQRLSGSAPVSAATGMLRMGSRGAKVRELQTLLVRAGYAVKVDGDYGPSTNDAVKDFQRAQKIKADGVAGPETLRRLDAFKQSADEQPGQQLVSDVPEVKDATKAGGFMVLVVAARDQVAETASYLTGIQADTAQTVANVLLAGSGAIGLGLAGYAIWGWFKSRRTDEGDIVQGEAPMSDPALP